jgi:acetolactate synthase-1/2/3 large subunit
MNVKAHVGIAKILKKEGVDWISVFPSSGMNTPCGEEGVKNLMMRTERFAVAVADGFSRVSDGKRFGVCSVQSGLNACGIEYAYGALAQAYEDSTPLLCITDGIQSSISNVKRYDVSNALTGISKWTGYINKPHRVSEFMNRAYSYLKSGNTGPIIIEAPRDLGEYEDSDYPYTSPKGWKPQGDPRDIKVAVRALLNSKNPLIYAGQGIFYGDACKELLKFAELVQIPVLTTLKGKSCFPENHPLSVGVKGAPAETMLKNSDLVFALGCSLNPGRRYGGFVHQIPDTKRSDLGPTSTKKTIVQCTIDPMDINRYYEVDHAIIGDIKLVLGQLIEEVEKNHSSIKPRKETFDDIEKAREEHHKKFTPLQESDDKPINPFRVYWELMNTIDRDNSLVTHDSGMTREQLATVYEAIIPHGFLGWGNVSTLGFGLGAAVGAKLAFPEREVVNFAGDASVGYQLSDYEAQVRNEIGITTIQINNDGFSGYGPGFWGKGGNPYVADVSPSTVVNMAKALESLGLYAERVEDPDEVSPAIKRAMKQNKKGKPAFIEVICSKYPISGPWLTK